MMAIGRRTVVCALSGTERDETLAPIAASLARRLGLMLDLVHVNRLVDLAGAAAGMPAMSIPVALPDVEERSRARLGQIAVVAGQEDACCDVLDGPPGLILQQISERRDLAYLVLGDHGAGPLRALVKGSITRHLLRTSGCPLVIVPREGALEAVEDPVAVVCAVEDETTAAPAVAAARDLGARLGVTVMIRTVEEGLLNLPDDDRPWIVVASAPQHGQVWSVLAQSLPERLLTRLNSQVLVLVPTGD
jgi:nucleotide-binding universal stress UspA family protein